MSKGLFTEDLFLFQYASLSKSSTRWGQHQVTLLRLGHIEYICCLYYWQEIIDFHVELTSKLIEILTPSSRLDQLHQACDIADSDMWKDLIGTRRIWDQRTRFGLWYALGKKSGD